MCCRVQKHTRKQRPKDDWGISSGHRPVSSHLSLHKQMFFYSTAFALRSCPSIRPSVHWSDYGRMVRDLYRWWCAPPVVATSWTTFCASCLSAVCVCCAEWATTMRPYKAFRFFFDGDGWDVNDLGSGSRSSGSPCNLIIYGLRFLPPFFLLVSSAFIFFFFQEYCGRLYNTLSSRERRGAKENSGQKEAEDFRLTTCPSSPQSSSPYRP